MTILTTVLAFAVTIGILITFHEAGHYLIARLFGVKVLRFSFGFGRPIYTYKSKKDGTEWTLSALPLGGYVRMLDERDPTCLPIRPEDEKRTFGSKNVYQRFAIVASGPLANLILAVVLYAVVFMIGTVQPLPVVSEPALGTPAQLAGIHAKDAILRVADKPVETFSDMRIELLKHAGNEVPVQIRSASGAESEKVLDLTKFNIDASDDKKDPFDSLGLELYVGSPFVRSVAQGSSAQKAGLKEGDRVLEADGKALNLPSELVSIIKSHPGKPVALLIETKDGKVEKRELTPDLKKEKDGSEIGFAGVALGADIPHKTVSRGLLGSVAGGLQKTWDAASMSLTMMGKMIVGEVSFKNISGPVTIADYAGKTASLGIAPFISFMALVSVSIGILNLFPIPMLDGGHLVYYISEMIRGKPVSENAQAIFQKIGIALLACLTFLAFFNDLNRLFSS